MYAYPAFYYDKLQKATRMCAFGYLLFFALVLTTLLVLSIIVATSSKRSMMDNFILVFNYTQNAKEQQQDDELLQDEQQQQQEQQQEQLQQQHQLLFKPKLFWVIDVLLYFTHPSIGKCFKNMSKNILQNFINSRQKHFKIQMPRKTISHSPFFFRSFFFYIIS